MLQHIYSHTNSTIKFWQGIQIIHLIDKILCLPGKMWEFLLLAALSIDINEDKSLFMGTYADLGLGFPSLLSCKIKYLIL